MYKLFLAGQERNALNSNILLERGKAFQKVCDALKDVSGVETDNTLEVDGCLRDGDLQVNFELKSAGDMLRSGLNRHLALQGLNMSMPLDDENKHPGIVVVYGDTRDVFAHQTSVLKGKGWRAPVLLEQERCRVMSLCSTLFGELNIPVFFWSSDPVQTARWTISHAKHVFEDGHIWTHLPKASMKRKAAIPSIMIAACPHIGISKSIALLKHFRTIRNMCNSSADEIMKVQVKGRKIGKSASYLVDALGVE